MAGYYHQSANEAALFSHSTYAILRAIRDLLTFTLGRAYILTDIGSTRVIKPLGNGLVCHPSVDLTCRLDASCNPVLSLNRHKSYHADSACVCH